MINKINIGGVDYDIAGSASKNKEWKPFAINRCIKPTSVVGARYYFPGNVRFSKKFYSNLYGDNPAKGLIMSPESDEYYLEYTHGNSDWEEFNLIEKGNGNPLRGQIVTIIGTPTIDNLDWIKVLSVYLYSRNQIINTDSPYLKILDGELICIKPATIHNSVRYSKYSSKKGMNSRIFEWQHDGKNLYQRKLWRKGSKGPQLVFVTKCRQKYYSCQTLTLGKLNTHPLDKSNRSYLSSAPYSSFGLGV